MEQRVISEKWINWFSENEETLETAYLSHEEPWRQSGMSGPENRWTSLRKPIADCMEQSGSFLDIGCANGYLLECVLKWTAERGLTMEPYGLDISKKLVDLAQARLPQYATNFYVGNSYTWMPPKKFDYVRTELVYVPADLEKDYVEFLLENYLTDNGHLLIANYLEGISDPEKRLKPGSHPTKYIAERLEELGIKPERYVDGYDSVYGRQNRVAVIGKQV